MVLSVNLPKKVAIRNQRLALLYWFSVMGMLVSLVLLKFVFAHDWALQVGISSQLTIAWDMDNSIQAMEQYFTNNPDALNECTQTGSRSHWGHDFDVVGTCTSMCALDNVLSHSEWSTAASSNTEANSRLCWTDFKQFGLNQRYTALQFLESSGRNDVSLITAKNDWMVDHETQTKTNYVESVPQGRDAMMTFEYALQRSMHAPWVVWNGQHTVGQGSTNGETYTLIVDSLRQPVGEVLQPGEPIRISVKQAWTLAARPNSDGTASELDGQGLAEGGEIGARVTCYGTDDELKEYMGKDAYGQTKNLQATFYQPVCLLQFTKMSDGFQIHANYGATIDPQTNYATEVVSETTGIRFVAAAGQGTARVPSFSVILLNLTSIVVLLSLPREVTTFIAARALGPLSAIYKRVIIEPFDVEQQAAATATVVAANSNAFTKISEKSSDGEDLLTLASMKWLMDKSFEARTEMNDKEIMALTAFCYEAMASHTVTHSTSHRGALLSLFGLDFLHTKKHPSSPKPKVAKAATHQMTTAFHDMDIHHEEEKEGITLDQYNSTRLESEKMTFDAIVDLFNKDRRRSRLEIFFTPRKIKRALTKAMDVQERMMFEQSDNVLSVADDVGKSVSGLVHRICSITEGTSWPLRSTRSEPSKQSPSTKPARGSEEGAPRLTVSFDDVELVADQGSECDDLPAEKGGEEKAREASPRRPEDADAKSVVQKLAEAKAATFDDLRRDLDKLLERLKAAETQQQVNLSEDLGAPRVLTISEMGARLAKVESVVAKLDPSMVPATGQATFSTGSGMDWATAIVDSFGDVLMSPARFPAGAAIEQNVDC